jgi:two-component system, chemotaxis family, response regulator WspR
VQRWTAILADDDPDSVPFVKDALQQQDYDVVVTSPTTVVAAAKTHKSALVLLAPSRLEPDVWLACRMLHADSEGHHVICLLDRYEPAAISRAFAAGADDALAKPLIPGELDARLRFAKRVLVLEESRSTLEKEGALLAEISTRASFHSRRYLQAELTNELARARRFSHALAVIVAEARHQEGSERTMRSFGQVLSGLCRSRVDWIARHGERTFALVLPETGLGGALRAGGRLQAELSAREVNDLPESLIVNLGVSALHRDNIEVAEKVGPQLLLDAAEHYLRDATRSGPGHMAGGPAPHA